MARSGLIGGPSRRSRHGEDAIELVLDLRPDVVLMDIKLPDIAGHTPAERSLPDAALWIQSRHSRPPRRRVTRASGGGRDRAGTNTFAVGGRINVKQLGPGSYRLAATPRQGKLAGATLTINFRLTR